MNFFKALFTHRREGSDSQTQSGSGVEAPSKPEAPRRKKSTGSRSRSNQGAVRPTAEEQNKQKRRSKKQTSRGAGSDKGKAEGPVKSSNGSAAELVKKGSGEDAGGKKSCTEEVNPKKTEEEVKKSKEKVAGEDLTMLVEKKSVGVGIKEVKGEIASPKLKKEKKTRRPTKPLNRPADESPTDFEKVDAPARPAVAHNTQRSAAMMMQRARNRELKVDESPPSTASLDFEVDNTVYEE